MRVFSHYEEVFIQVGVNVIGIPEFVVHKIARYVDIKDEIPFQKNMSKSYIMLPKRVQKFSSTRPKIRKDI